MTKNNSERVLRDYQRTAVKNTVDASRRGVRSGLFVCPTGGGKSPVFATLAGMAAAKGARTLILTDRKVLADQAAAYVRGWAPWLSVGIEQGPRRIGETPPDVVCATIQSMTRTPARLRRFAPDAFGLIVVDEADLGIAPSYRAVLERFPGAFVFGCTATPDRGDRRSLGEVFDEIVYAVDMADLVERGYLSPLRRSLVRIESVSLEKVCIHSDDGDFADAALGRILSEERALHEVVKPTLELAGDRPTLAFAATVSHAEALAAMFNRYHPGSARAIHGDTNSDERSAILGAFRRREFQFLCNCALLLRGIDLPFVSCVAMARPTRSRSLYVQSLGRGTRVAPGKADLLVLDFTDNSATHDLVSPIDVLAPAAPEDVKERAREIMDDEQGADPLEVIKRAAAELGADAVLRERVRAKVAFRLREPPTRNKGIDWDGVVDLGKKLDSEIAKREGVSKEVVGAARRARGIPPFRKPNRQYLLKAADLGLVSDDEFARRHEVSTTTAWRLRQKRGIPPISPPPPSKGINWEEQPLGKKPDIVIATDLGVSDAVVRYHRVRRGISAFRNPMYSGVDWDSVKDLGAVPDGVIAQRYGVSTSAVANQRKKRGIPAQNTYPRMPRSK